jgi:hypothetical protein
VVAKSLSLSAVNVTIPNSATLTVGGDTDDTVNLTIVTGSLNIAGKAVVEDILTVGAEGILTVSGEVTVSEDGKLTGTAETSRLVILAGGSVTGLEVGNYTWNGSAWTITSFV